MMPLPADLAERLRHWLPPLAAALLLLPAWHFKHPLLYSLRWLETPLLVGLPIVGLLAGRHLSRLTRGLLAAALLVALAQACEYRLQRSAVLAAGPAMQAVGRHFVVGYDDLEEVRELAAKGLIGGIYLTRRNVRGRSFAELAGEIAGLQALRERAELPPLIVAADQEGGPVAHLSPLLERLPPLAQVASGDDGEALAERYGFRQGRGLAALGVTLNFGPVVDLKPSGPSRTDRLSNIAARALSGDPGEVSRIAAAYLGGLNAAGVGGTLKHFPGLGRVSADTHLRPARLDLPPAALAADWQPFRRLAGRPETAIMLGHVTLTTLDPTRAASHSPAVVNGLLREEWAYNGVLITDDLNMGAVYRLGIGRVAGEALAAGVDLVLVSYDPRQVYRALYGAAQALEQRELPPARLTASRERLATTWPRLAAACHGRPEAEAKTADSLRSAARGYRPSEALC